MTRILLVSLAGLALTGAATTLWLKSQPVRSPDVVAQCIAAQLSGAEKAQLGSSATFGGVGGTVRLRRLDYLGCRGAGGVVANAETRAREAQELTQVLSASPDFRGGLQRAAWARSGYHGDAKEQLTQLTIMSARHAVQRAWAVGCQKLTPAQADELRDMELPLLTVISGTNGWVDSVPRARQLASGILEQAKFHAVAEASSAGADCEDRAMASGLDIQRNAASQFLAGTHPSAPGCKVVAEQGEFVLQCGTPKP